jgi:hypothetical protein
MENNTTLTEKPNKDLINVLKKKLTQKIRIQAKYINDKTDKVIGKCKVKDTFNE